MKSKKDNHKWIGGYKLGHPAIPQDRIKVKADCGHVCLAYETRIRGDGSTLCPACVPLLTGALAGGGASRLSKGGSQ